MADIVVSSKKKINLFDRVIQSVVILVNMTKMNRAIDEHLNVIRKTEGDDQKLYQENILREIVFVKYQYDIMQRDMYGLKLSYSSEILQKINSSDKIDRLELQKNFLEMEYDRITKARFKSKDDIKFGLFSISSAIDSVKQNIKDEGKSQRYNKIIKGAEDIDTKIQTDEYTDDMYDTFFESINDYVDYINDNYDISKLPSDERELIEYVIETMIKGIESDIDKHMYEYDLVINICKNSYRYFQIIDKIFEKLQKIYDESFEKDILTLDDYVKMYKEIYDMKIKTKVNDVHRTIATEDEYLEYSKLITNEEDELLEEFIIKRAIELTKSDEVKQKLQDVLESRENTDDENVDDGQDIADVEIKDLDEKQIEEVVLDEENKNDSKEENTEGNEPKKRGRGRPRKNSN